MNTGYILLVISGLCIFYINAEPLVKISQGILNGTLQIARYGKSFSAFLGIPYARPPIGNRRFRNPEPAPSWRGIRAANSFGNICTQINEQVSGTEDCLFLNVYTPFLSFETQMPTSKLLPVMVWIHGGSFLTGSSNIYGPGYLLQKDIILVTINYRLGVFGFLATSDSLAPGNFGLKDQVMALKWVRKNIRAFGGDANKVTLFGESSGGVAVNLHAVSKASNGLFQKYIIQSGTVVGPGAYRDRQEIDADVKILAKSFQCPVNTSRAIINCLRKISSVELMRNMTTLGTVLKYGRFVWTATIEPPGTSAFLTENPLTSVNNNRMKDLPFMSGTVTEEGLAFIGPSYTNDMFYQLFKQNAPKIFSNLATHYKQDERQFFSAIDRFYFNNTFNSSSKDEYLTRVVKLLSDAVYFYPEIRLLEKVTLNMRNKNYLYNFGYRGAISLSAIAGDTQNRGVAHADELLYLFPVTYGPLVTSNANFTPADEKISKIMVDFWTSFATNGKPTSCELYNPNLWQAFSPTTSAHIQIGNIRNNRDPTVTMSNDYYRKQMNFWWKLAPI